MRQGPTPAVLVALLSLAGSVALGASDEPPLPDSRIGLRTAPLLLLSRPDIRADLELTPEQSESSARAIRSFYVQAHALRGKGNSPETIRERRAVDDEAAGWIHSRLSPEQKTRLAQLDLQWEGPSALVSRAVVVQALNLSSEQISTMRNAVALRNQLRDNGQADADARLLQAALTCLSDSQREAWKGLLGKRLAFATIASASVDSTRR